jgi:hypothetical protein
MNLFGVDTRVCDGSATKDADARGSQCAPPCQMDAECRLLTLSGTRLVSGPALRYSGTLPGNARTVWRVHQGLAVTFINARSIGEIEQAAITKAR